MWQLWALIGAKTLASPQTQDKLKEASKVVTESDCYKARQERKEIDRLVRKRLLDELKKGE